MKIFWKRVVVTCVFVTSISLCSKKGQENKKVESKKVTKSCEKKSIIRRFGCLRKKKWEKAKKPVVVKVGQGDCFGYETYTPRCFEIEYYAENIALAKNVIKMNEMYCHEKIDYLKRKAKVDRSYPFVSIFKDGKSVEQVRALLNEKFPVRYTVIPMSSKTVLLKTLKNLKARQVYILRNECSNPINELVHCRWADVLEREYLKRVSPDMICVYKNYKPAKLLILVERLDRMVQSQLAALEEKEKLKNSYKKLRAILWEFRNCTPF